MGALMLRLVWGVGVVWDITQGCVICRGREVVRGTADGEGSAVEDMGVDHRGADVVVTEELLHGADVVAVFEEMRGERMPQRVAGGSLVNRSQPNGVFYCPLNRAFMYMMAVEPTVLPVAVVLPCGKDPLPGP